MYKVVIADFEHETNTFNPNRTTLAHFGDPVRNCDKQRIMDLRGTRSCLGAIIDTIDAHGDISIIPTVRAAAEPWGPVCRDAYDFYKNEILRCIDEAGAVDAVVMWLHGAMVVEDCEDGEGELLAAIRAKVGPAVPITAGLDLHANVTQKMLANATALFPNDYYPHTDSYDRCVEAASCALDVLDGRSKPVMHGRKLPMLSYFIPTKDPRLAKFTAMAHEYEEDPRVVSVSIAFGFFCADIQESGLTCIAVCKDDPTLAQDIADKFAAAVWADRCGLVRHFDDLDQSLDDIAASADPGPFIIADCCDNPGGGSPGSSTHILRRLLDRGVKNAAIFAQYDPETVAAAEKTGVGNCFQASIGGRLFPDILGPAVVADAYVKAINDGRFSNQVDGSGNALGSYGKLVVLVIKGIEVICMSRTVQAMTPDTIRACGIDPLKRKLIVLKSAVHFRHAYEPIGKRIYDVIKPGLHSQSPQGLVFQRCQRPIWPLDDI